MFVGEIEFPANYTRFNTELKYKIVEKIVDNMYYHFDKLLLPEINRINYITQVFLSTLQDAERDEQYEFCALIRDCINLIDELQHDTE